MRVVDLSYRLRPGMQVYPGSPLYACKPVHSVDKDGYSVHLLSLSSHTGTHIDVPSHFILNGKTVDQMPLSTFIGPVLVVDVTGKKPREKIVWDDLSRYEHKMKPGLILFLHTGWSEYWCTQKYYDHPFLDPHAAEKIIQTGIRVVGIDAISVDETRVDGTIGKDGFGVHLTILGSDGVIVENLTNLKALDSGEGYMASVVPLNLDGVDGSPVRAHAWRHGTFTNTY
jgi:kynurenine formamidase